MKIEVGMNRGAMRSSVAGGGAVVVATSIDMVTSDSYTALTQRRVGSTPSPSIVSMKNFGRLSALAVLFATRSVRVAPGTNVTLLALRLSPGARTATAMAASLVPLFLAAACHGACTWRRRVVELAPVASIVGTTVGSSCKSPGQLGVGSSTALNPPVTSTCDGASSAA